MKTARRMPLIALAAVLFSLTGCQHRYGYTVTDPPIGRRYEPPIPFLLVEEDGGNHGAWLATHLGVAPPAAATQTPSLGISKINMTLIGQDVPLWENGRYIGSGVWMTKGDVQYEMLCGPDSTGVPAFARSSDFLGNVLPKQRTGDPAQEIIKTVHSLDLGRACESVPRQDPHLTPPRETWNVQVRLKAYAYNNHIQANETKTITLEWNNPNNPYPFSDCPISDSWVIEQGDHWLPVAEGSCRPGIASASEGGAWEDAASLAELAREFVERAFRQEEYRVLTRTPEFRAFAEIVSYTEDDTFLRGTLIAYLESIPVAGGRQGRGDE